MGSVGVNINHLKEWTFINQVPDCYVSSFSAHNFDADITPFHGEGNRCREIKPCFQDHKDSRNLEHLGEYVNDILEEVPFELDVERQGECQRKCHVPERQKI